MVEEPSDEFSMPAAAESEPVEGKKGKKAAKAKPAKPPKASKTGKKQRSLVAALMAMLGVVIGAGVVLVGVYMGILWIGGPRTAISWA